MQFAAEIPCSVARQGGANAGMASRRKRLHLLQRSPLLPLAFFGFFFSFFHSAPLSVKC